MGKKHIFLLITFAVLIVASGAYVVGGTQVYSRYQQNALAKEQFCGGQDPVHICLHTPAAIFSAFYPSYIASQLPLFTIDYSSTRPLTLVISASIDHLSQVQTQTVTATSAMQTSAFIPPLLDQALQGLTEEENTTFHVQVTDTQKHLYYLNDAPIVMHSRWLMQWIAQNRLKIAAWVTPNAPAITALASKALTHLAQQQQPVPSGLIGYKTATPQQVIDQVDAIYDTLRLDYHMHYVQASVPYSGTGDSSASTETIKLPTEVLQQGSGMCIELTTLLSSAVEHIGLHPAIVIIPGHAFLGVSVAEDNTHFEYWDAVGVDNNVAADSANVQADNLYKQNLQKHTIVDTILLSDARSAHIGPML